MKKYKIGLIGYGGFGTFLRHWWSKMDNIEVAAIAYLDHEGWGGQVALADPQLDHLGVVAAEVGDQADLAGADAEHPRRQRAGERRAPG